MHYVALSVSSVSRFTVSCVGASSSSKKMHTPALRLSARQPHDHEEKR